MVPRLVTACFAIAALTASAPMQGRVLPAGLIVSDTRQNVAEYPATKDNVPASYSSRDATSQIALATPASGSAFLAATREMHANLSGYRYPVQCLAAVR